jgi:hypothetical protein
MAANFHEPEVSLLHRFLVARDNDIEKAKVRPIFPNSRKALGHQSLWGFLEEGEKA